LATVLVSVASLVGPATAGAATTQYATLVRTIDTSALQPNSPDTAGVTYRASTGSLIFVDSEVDEMPAFWQGVNAWQLSMAGIVQRTWTTVYSSAPKTTEPTGVVSNRCDDHLFYSTDASDKIIELNPGGDGLFGTTDDSRTSLVIEMLGADDTEDLALDPAGCVATDRRLFTIDGKTTDVYVERPGPNGVFDGVPLSGFNPSGDDTWSSFDVGTFGIIDPEGIYFNEEDGHLYVLSSKSGKIVEIAANGSTLYRTIDISAVNPGAVAGLALAPASSGGGMHFYLAERGLDNNQVPTENDGRIYEIRLDSAPPPPPPPPSGNRIVNGGFEIDANPADTFPDSWSTNSAATRSVIEAHQGTYSMRHQATDDRSYTLTQRIGGLSAGYVYAFSGWVDIPATTDAFTFKLQVTWRSASGGLGTVTVVSYKKATAGWVHPVASMTAPAGTTSADVKMVVNSLSAAIYVDDLSLSVSP
jgi:hypothetical protein